MTGISPDTLAKILDLDGIEVNSVVLTEQNELYLEVSSTIQGTNCHCCGHHTETYYCQGNKVKLRHLPIFGLATYISIETCRYRCDHCDKTTTQLFPWYDQRLTYTQKFSEHVLLSLINSTIKDVAIKENIGYDVVEGIIEKNIDSEINWDKIKQIDVLGIDEISIKKGHKDFVVIVTGFIKGQLTLLAVLKDRKKETVKKFSLYAKTFKKTS